MSDRHAQQVVTTNLLTQNVLKTTVKKLAQPKTRDQPKNAKERWFMIGRQARLAQQLDDKANTSGTQLYTT